MTTDGLTERSSAIPKGIGTPELILHEAREVRAKQDRKLQALLRLATGGLVVLLSAGTIAVAASRQLAPETAVVIFCFVLVLGVNTVLIEGVAFYWKEGPDIGQLLAVFRGLRPTSEQLQLALIVASTEDHDYNNRTLRRVRALVVLQMLVVFVGLVVLLLGFRELT